MWALSKKDPKVLEALTKDQVDNIPEAGDGNAVFFGEGSEDEWKEEQDRRKGFLGRLFRP